MAPLPASSVGYDRSFATPVMKASTTPHGHVVGRISSSRSGEKAISESTVLAPWDAVGGQCTAMRPVSSAAALQCTCISGVSEQDWSSEVLSFTSRTEAIRTYLKSTMHHGTWRNNVLSTTLVPQACLLHINTGAGRRVQQPALPAIPMTKLRVCPARADAKLGTCKQLNRIDRRHIHLEDRPGAVATVETLCSLFHFARWAVPMWGHMHGLLKSIGLKPHDVIIYVLGLDDIRTRPAQDCGSGLRNGLSGLFKTISELPTRIDDISTACPRCHSAVLTSEASTWDTQHIWLEPFSKRRTEMMTWWRTFSAAVTLKSLAANNFEHPVQTLTVALVARHGLGRQFVNEQEAWGELEGFCNNTNQRKSFPGGLKGVELDCRLVAFESMSFPEQIKTASALDIMIGAHGAGMTHVAWMREGGVQVEIPYAPGYCLSNFRDMSSLSGVHYACFPMKVARGDSACSRINASRSGLRDRCNNIVLDMNTLIKVVTAAVLKRVNSSAPWPPHGSQYIFV